MSMIEPPSGSEARLRRPDGPGADGGAPIGGMGTGAVAAAVAGAVAGAAAIAIGELLAGLLPGAPSPVVALGDLVIGLQPPGAKEIAVELFGTNDKLALSVAVIGVAIALAAGIGVVGRRRWARAVAWVGVGGVVLALAALREPL
ncbi:MAG: hypothetical protein ACOYXS_02000, partial [Chloroflexota bacterium]